MLHPPLPAPHHVSTQQTTQQTLAVLYCTDKSSPETQMKERIHVFLLHANKQSRRGVGLRASATDNAKMNLAHQHTAAENTPMRLAWFEPASLTLDIIVAFTNTK